MPDQPSRLTQVYAGALQRDPEERDEYLDRACAGQPELRARVAELLQKHALDFEATHPGLGPPGDAPGARTGETVPRRGSSDIDIAGKRIGSYVVRRQLGAGGMGVVYLAHDTRLERTVAIKALNPAVSHAPGIRERLFNEARVVANLEHPGIAAVHALEEIDGELYMVCEFVQGAPLRALVEKGPLPIAEVIDIGIQLAQALAAAHTKGIVHRDIKPENVMKTPSGTVKVLDFGLAKANVTTQARLTQTGVVLGTPAYLSPEQALGHAIDFRTDIFALGVLLYELASGRHPFVAGSVPATMQRIVEEDPPPLSDVQPRSVPELDRIIQRCLQKDPAARYTSTQDVITDLEHLRASVLNSDSSFRPRLRTSPHRWLINHQIVMSVVYIALLYPAWYARAFLPAPWNMWFVLTVLAAAACATSLRLHLLFIATTFPHQLARQQTATQWWTRLSDVVFAGTQVSAALAVSGNHPEFAMLFVGASVAVLVASFVIEPATTRTALGER